MEDIKKLAEQAKRYGSLTVTLDVDAVLALQQKLDAAEKERDAATLEYDVLNDMIKFWQEKAKALSAENARMDNFVDSVLAIAWQGSSADGADIQELALKNGLIRHEVYCADMHETLVEDPGNFEDGDDVYFRVEGVATDEFLNAVRAEGKAEAEKALNRWKFIKQFFDVDMWDADDYSCVRGLVFDEAKFESATIGLPHDMSVDDAIDMQIRAGDSDKDGK